MDYDNIAWAVKFYRERGYVYVDDAPWMVDRSAYYATKPLTVQADVIMTREDGSDRKFLVASGEQSFIQMMLDGQPLKRAICVTPCFRVDRYDSLRRPAFMKAELINAHDVDEDHLIHMVHEACSFFELFFPVRIIKTEIGYDIVEKGTRIELGSYGIRDIVLGPNHDGDLIVCHSPNAAELPGRTRLRWIYGTACAEPRLSTVIMRRSKETGK